MNRGIRWVAPKSSRMSGVGTPADPVYVLSADDASAPASPAAPSPTGQQGGHTLMEKLIFGGLLVAGATAAVTVLFVRSRK